MISIGSGADALVFDIFHVCFFVVALLMAGLAIWLRHVGKTRLAASVTETEALRLADARQFEQDLSGLQSRLELEISALRARAQAEQDAFQRERVGWDGERSGMVDLRQRTETAERRLAAYEAHNAERDRAFEAEKEALKAFSEDVQRKFQGMADSALRSSQAQFLQLADEHLQKHKEGATGELKSLIKPIQESFGQFREKVDAIQKVTNEDRASMQEQIRQVGEAMQFTQSVTNKLANALSAPKSGGRWGEETLRNVLEMAGLSQHADFTEQSHSQTENGAIRPDVTIRMPGGRELVIDSKVSVDDFLRASEEPDTDKQAALLASHARKVRAHVTALGKKSYWADLSDAVDFVAMFIPGENFYAAALQSDRELFDYAAKNKVIIVTPSTLIALAKAVAYGWRQEEAANNAREITDMARELYARMANMGDRVVRLGKGISGAASAYNDLVGTLETKVMPQARKFEAMGMDADGKAVPELDSIEDHVREPKRGRDLLFDASEGAPELPLLGAARSSGRKTA